MSVKQWRDVGGEMTDNEMFSVRASRRADVTVLPLSESDAAHRNYGHAIADLERLERHLAKAFQNLQERTEALRESGTRAEPVFDALPLVGAAHTAWIGSHVGEAPLGTPVA